LARGIYDLLTIYSRTPTAGPLTDLNNRSLLSLLLQQKLGASRAAEIIGKISRRDRFLDVFDFYFREQLTRDELDQIAGSVTVAGASPRGRINVNTAPRDVLLCLGISSSDVDTLIAQRPAPGTSTSNSIAWVADALQQKAVGLGNQITAQPGRYSADIVAVSANGRA